MRLLHTSDWHVGRTLHAVDLLEYHRTFCDDLVRQVRERHVDVVVIAGDVYDRAVPPTEAVALLSSTLTKLSELCQVIITSGNHDSAIRLGFAAGAMRPSLHFYTDHAQVGTPVIIPGPDIDVAIYPIPYLDPDVARHTLATGEEPLGRSHQAVMSAAMDRVRADAGARRALAATAGQSEGRAGAGECPHGVGHGLRTVVTAHAFVVGGQVTESERDIRVGGVDSVAADTFAGVDYVALGHLHGPQQITGPTGTIMRYSGSPLPFSFSEAGQRKSMVLVDITADGVATELVPTPVTRALTKLTGTLAELLGPLAQLHHDDWVQATVTDPARPTDLYARLKSAYPHLLVVRHIPDEPAPGHEVAAVYATHDPLDVAADFVTWVTGAPPSEEEVAVLRSALEAVNKQEMSA